MSNGGADLMEKRLREYIEVKSGFADKVNMERMLTKTFSIFDLDQSGSLDLSEFCSALKTINCVGSAQDMADLFDKYDEDCNQTISYKEFSAGVFASYREGLEGGVALPSSGLSNVQKNLIARAKDVLIKNGGAKGLQSAKRLLKSMDSDGSGTLDKDELKLGLEMLGVTGLTDDEVMKLMHAFDKDKSGKVSIEELYYGLQGTMKRKRKLIVRLAFDMLDSDGSGEVTVDDIRNNYDVTQDPRVQKGEITGDQCLAEVLATYDGVEGDGIITFSEFLEYYRDMSAAITNDDYFELMIRNAWHISGGVGAAANTSCRRVLVTHSDSSEEVCEIKNDLGIGPKDIAKMRVKLVAQGVKDIVKITV